jgi:hypothetical protein
MPAPGKNVAVARFILGYSWPETASALGTSINAAQKALSSGIRQTFGTCMRELRKMGSKEFVDFKKGKKVKSNLFRLK